MPDEESATNQIHSKNRQIQNLLAKIKRFEFWYQYGEQVGQVRLYNFLMADSILFLACATLIAAEKNVAYIFAIILAMFGYFLSRMWKIYGERQGKFIDMFEHYAKETLKDISKIRASEESSLPFYYLSEMKNVNSTVITSDCKFFLNDKERKVSTRTTLVSVPRYFQYAFAVTGIVSLIGLAFSVVKLVSKFNFTFNIQELSQ